ncbi:MAG TPA: hypothetical protein VHG93_19845 [Longimicrobium sp.]|nr:hypothetical protein [Longimicrobium sp.]
MINTNPQGLISPGGTEQRRKDVLCCSVPLFDTDSSRFWFFVDFVAGKQGDAELSFRRRRPLWTQPVQEAHGAD